MVSVVPTNSSPNAVASWLWYGMLASAFFALTNAFVGNEIEGAIRKKV